MMENNSNDQKNIWQIGQMIKTRFWKNSNNVPGYGRLVARGSSGAVAPPNDFT